ncbi:uncharacterized protein LOC135467803 [Liolophura sinensis]|uniref:uncharacterized protein LOC135467803 n=1 Tax=Liolophura sinensis TaxID=3198878 RepID=UPI00315932F7
MDIRDRKRIQRNYDYLIEDMSDVLDNVIDYCYSKEILSESLKTSVMTSVRKEDKCRKFIDMFLKKRILCKEETAFQVLCDALDRCDSSHIKNTLLETDVKDVTEDEEVEDGSYQYTSPQGGESGDAGRQNTVINITNSKGFHIGNQKVINFYYPSKPKP